MIFDRKEKLEEIRNTLTALNDAEKPVRALSGGLNHVTAFSRMFKTKMIK